MCKNSIIIFLKWTWGIKTVHILIPQCNLIVLIRSATLLMHYISHTHTHKLFLCSADQEIADDHKNMLEYHTQL